MLRVVTFFCALLISQVDLNIGKNIGATDSPVSNEQSKILDIQTKLLKLQDEIVSITEAIAFAENFDTLKAKIKSADESFEKIKGELAVERQQHDSSDTTITLINNQYNTVNKELESLHKSIEEYKKKQLPAVIVSDIKERRFKPAEESLALLNTFEDVSRIIRTVYGSCSDSFELLANFIESLDNTEVIFYTVKAVREEMNESGHKNPFKWMRLVKTIEAGVINNPDADAQTRSRSQVVVAELQNSIRTYTLDTLKKAATHKGKFEKNDELDELETELFLANPARSENIIQQFVNESYGLIQSKKILGTIESHRFIEQKIIGVKTLFSKLQEAGNHNSDVFFPIATALHKIHSDKQFKLLGKEKHESVIRMINDVPLCARNLIFEPYVCFWNKAKEEYLIAADSRLNHDRERRNVFVSDALPGSQWVVKSQGDNFLFSSRTYANEYLYTAAFNFNDELRYVFTWLPKNNTDVQSEYSIELDGDYCYVKSAPYNEYLFASYLRRPNVSHLRNVFTWIPGTGVRGPEFQWQIRNCDKPAGRPFDININQISNVIPYSAEAKQTFPIKILLLLFLGIGVLLCLLFAVKFFCSTKRAPPPMKNPDKF